MRKTFFAALALALVAAGCAGPEQKMGRGLNNISELVRGGEIRRSMEQTAIFQGPDVGYTAGFLHGLNRSIGRTFTGIYEVATFPIPPYEPVFFPANPVYPENYKPNIIADSIFSTDTSLGFGGGDVLPFVPGSRFHIFDN